MCAWLHLLCLGRVWAADPLGVFSVKSLGELLESLNGVTLRGVGDDGRVWAADPSDVFSV